MVMEISNNPNPNSNDSSSSVRVLVRSPSSSPTSSDPSSSSASNGVVVVGFIGPRAAITTHLMNRIVDSTVFGSGNSDKTLCVDKEELRGSDWFSHRRLSYHRDDQNGILFLHFSSDFGGGFEFGSAIEEEELEFGNLQGMLFMFSVCHVIIYIQDGSRFDTQLLKKFRVLQAAKNGLVPFVRSQITAGLPPNSRPHLASQSSRPNTSAPPATNNPSPGKNRSILSRGGSSISLMSGLGSYTSLFPGQRTPVMLFVFMDDFSDTLNPSSNVEESTDVSTSQNLSSSSGSTRPNLPAKVSSPVVVLARPVNKSEGGFRKKLQSSMEAQVRFLIKKCRTLSGSETSHGGPRSGGVLSSSVPLFSLDSSRAVALLDRSANRRGESLEYATRLVEDVLSGKATSDSLLLENHALSANKEDITSVKDFIYRQSDILRGRGAMVANSNSGSGAGVGMVAVAAAAAAASAASGKTFMAPELPNMEVWLSSSQIILHGILSAKGGCLGDIEISKRKPRPRNAIPPTSEAVASKAKDPLDVAVSWLESGKGLNTKFSTLWCERTLPAAKEVYLKDLPACYPTSMHEAHLEKALLAFRSMVKGPTVQHFAKRLEDECTAVWKSGRQLCDAVSLTGKPCMHQIHDLQTGESMSGSGGMPHCSGYVFLHACACGRSRKLRRDPFDFESANTTSCYADCDKLLPALQLPNLTDAGPVKPSSWSLIRVGGAKYYEPSKGLLQSGFCVTQKFLSKWDIFIENRKSQNGFTVAAEYQGSGIKSSSTDPKFKPEVITNKMSTVDMPLFSGEVHSGAENQTNLSKNVMLDDKIISFGKGLPNFTLRKPFAEVVAGSATGDSGFPPLQQKKQHSSSLGRSNIKQSKIRDLSLEHITDHQGSRKSERTLSALDTLNGIGTHNSTNGNPYLCIGSNVVPDNQHSGEKMKKNPSFRHAAVYVGYEHECPRGHRFLLNLEHLNELGNLYQLPEESQISSSVDISDQGLGNPSKLNNNIRRGKVHQVSNRTNVSSTKKERNGDRSKEVVANGYSTLDRVAEFTGPDNKQNHMSFGISKLQVHDFVKDPQGSLDCICIDDSGQALSMLNRNLPIYMNCPHCRNSKNSKELPKVKFAGTISQLQRIFVVTPSYPIVLATCPLIQFEASCLPTSISRHEQKLQFSLGNEVVLPPESFLTLRLPFVYGVETECGGLQSFKYFEHQPEATAWIIKGTTLRIVSRINSNAGQ